jgi:rubrerythrin
MNNSLLLYKFRKYSKYKTHFYCSFCGIWIKKEEAISHSPFLCPFCKRPMRIKPRKRGIKK